MAKVEQDIKRREKKIANMSEGHGTLSTQISDLEDKRAQLATDLAQEKIDLVEARKIVAMRVPSMPKADEFAQQLEAFKAHLAGLGEQNDPA
eukprot:7934488-Pyramimonas_sp.AAC.1